MRRSRLARLALGTALGTGLIAAVAANPTVVPGDVASRTPGVTVGNLDGKNATVALPTGRAIINWKQFNVDTGGSITFTTPTSAAGAVLNRVVGAGGSIPVTHIDGAITSKALDAAGSTANLQVFVLNSAGVMFGPGAAVNVGGLIASTLNLRDSDFRAGTLHFRPETTGATLAIVPADPNTPTLQPTPGATTQDAAGNWIDDGDGTGASYAAGAGPGAIGLSPNQTGSVSITATGAVDASTAVADRALGGLYLIGASITASGGATALTANRDVALVAGNDVTITPKADSPLSVRIDAGTAVAGAIAVNATIKGQNVTLALATATGVFGTLTASGAIEATGAASSGNGVVELLADAAGDTVALPGGGVAKPSSVTLQAASVKSDGPVTVSAGLLSLAGASFAPYSATTARPDLDFTSLTGDLSTGALTGAAITLRSAGRIDTGALDATGAISLASAAGIRTAGLVAGGDIAIAAGSRIGQPAAVAVTGPVRAGGAVTATSLGDQSFTDAITAGRDVTLTAGLAAPAGFNASGFSITTGDVSTIGAVAFNATSIGTGAVAGNSIRLDGLGGVTTGNLDAGPGAATISALGGTATIGGGVTAGAYRVRAGTILLAPGAAAITQRADTIDLAATGGALRGGAGLQLVGGRSVRLYGENGVALDPSSGIGGSSALAVAVGAGAAQAIALGGVRAASLGSATFDTTTGEFSGSTPGTLATTGAIGLGGPVTLASALRITTSGVGGITTHRIALSGTGSDLLLDTSAPGAGITLVNDLAATGATLSAPGAVTLRAAGALTDNGGGASVMAGGTASADGASVRLGTISGRTANVGVNGDAPATVSLNALVATGTDIAADGIAAQARGQVVDIAAASTASGRLALSATQALTLGSGTGVDGVSLVAGTAGGAAATLSAGPLLSTRGAVTATNRSGDLSLAGATASLGVAVGATGDAAVTGAVGVSSGDYTVSGATVTLGGGANPVTQMASGALSITAGTAISGANVSLVANSTGAAGGGPLTLATTAPNARIALGGTSLIADGSSIRISAASAGDALVLGDVRAGELVGRIVPDPSVLPLPDYQTGITRTGPITLGAVTLADRLVVDAGGALTTGALQANGIALAGAGGAVASARSTGDIRIRSIAGSIALGTAAATGGAITAEHGSVTLEGAGDFTHAGPITAIDGDLVVSNAGGFIGNGTLASTRGNVVVANLGASTGGAITATDGSIAISNGGSFTGDAVTATGGSVTIGNTGDFVGGAVTATNGNVTVANLGSFAGGAIAATDGGITIRNAGAFTGGAVAATNGTVAIANSGRFTGAGVTAVNGNITIGGTGDFASSAAVRATSLAVATGGIAVTRAGGFSAPGLIADRDILIGGIVPNTTLTAIGDARAGGAITIARAGDIRAASLFAGGAIAIGTADPLATRPASVVVTGATTSGGALTTFTTGDQSFGDASSIGGPARYTAGGDLLLGDAIVHGATTVKAASLVARSIASDGRIDVTTQGLTQAGMLSASGIAVNAGAIAISALADARGGDLQLTSNGALQLRAGRGNNLTFSADGAATIGTASATGDLMVAKAASLAGYAGDRATLTANGAITVTVAGSTLLATAQGGTGVRITAGAIDAEGVSAPGGAVQLTTTNGDLRGRTITGASGVTLAAAGAALIGSAMATGPGADLVITRAASLRGLDAPRATLAAGRDLSATVDGALVAGPVTAGGAARLTAGQIDLSSLSANSATLLAKAGDIRADSVNASTVAATADARTVAITGLTAATGTIEGGTITIGQARGGDLTATSLAGPLTVADLVLTGDATLAARTDATVTTADAGGRIMLTAGGRVSSTSLRAGRALIVSGTTLALGTAAGATAALTATGGPLQVDDVTGPGGVTLTQAGAGGIVVGKGAFASTGAVTITSGGDVSAPVLRAGTSATLRTGGTAVIGALTADTLDLASGGAATLGTLALANAGSITAQGPLAITGAVGAGSLAATGSAVTLGAAGTSVLQQARGQLAFTAAAGAITGLSGLTLLSNAGAGGGDLLLAATNGIAFAPGTTLRGGVDHTAALRLAPGAGAAVTLDVVAARTLASLEPTLTATSFSHDGPVSIADLSLRDTTIIALTGPRSALTIGDGSVANGAFDLRTDGALVAGRLAAADALSARGGTVEITGASGASVTLASSAGPLTVATATSGGDAVLSAATDLRVGSVVAAGLARLRAGGNATGLQTADGSFGRMVLSARDVDLATSERGDAGGLILADTIVANGGSATATGRVLDITAINAGGDVRLQARDPGGASVVSLRVGAVDAGGAATLVAAAGNQPLGSANGSVLVDTATARNGALTIMAASSHAARNGGGSVLAAHGAVGDIIVGTATGATITSASADRDLDVQAGAGDLAVGSAVASRGMATFRTGSRGSIAVGQVAAGTQLAIVSAGDLLLPGTARAGGDARLSATGLIQAADLAANGAITLAADQASLGQVQAGGDLGVVAAGITADRLASAGGTLTLTATAGDLLLPGTARAGGDARLSATGLIRAADLAANGAITLAAGQASLGQVQAGGDLGVVAAGITADRLASAGGMLTLAATGGDLSAGAIMAGAAANVSATGAASLARADVGGTLALRAGTIDLGTGQVGGAARLVAANRAAVQALASGGDLAVTAGTIAAGQINSGGELLLTAGAGGLTLGASATAGTATLATTGLATIGTLSAQATLPASGDTVRVSAADLDVTGGITGAAITLTNLATTNGLRIGDAPAANGADYAASSRSFTLSNAELGRLSATRLVINGGTGAVTLGETTLGLGAGRQLFQVATTGRLDVLGRFAAAGSPVTRRLILGGDGANGMAGVLRVAATATGGGRLIADDATLELRADRIAVGIDQNFLSALGVNKGATPVSAVDVNTRFVSQPSSNLYNAAFGTALGSFTDRTLVDAGRLVVRYGSFALFQNTGLAGTTSGVTLGGRGADGAALTLDASQAPNAFALFGSINGIGGTATALLGTTTVAVGGEVSRQSSRANGCLIGAGGSGCLASNLVQPNVNAFDVSRADVFRSAEDLTVPFEPLVSTSNEALFSDIAAIAQDAEAPNCPPGAGRCPPAGTAP